jgi:hypothetical protein
MLAKGEKIRILAVVPGADAVHSVTLRMRPAGAGAWTERSFKLLGRKTWETWLELPATPGPVVEYSVTASAGGKTLQAPVQGVYRLTVS